MPNKEKEKSHAIKYIVLSLLSLSVIVTGITVFYYAFEVPVDVSYGNTFGAVIQQAEFDADMPHIRQDLVQLENRINQTFPDVTLWNTTYNSWFPQDHTRDNSLWSNYRYIATVIDRIDYYEGLLHNQSGSSTTLTDLTQQYTNNVRSEMISGGGLDWALKGAWFLQFHPLIYWKGYVYSLIALVGGLPLFYVIYEIVRNFHFDDSF